MTFYLITHIICRFQSPLTKRFPNKSSNFSRSLSSTTAKSLIRSPQIVLSFLSLSIGIPVAAYLFSTSPPPLQPHLYSDQPLKSTRPLTPFHKLISVTIPPASQKFFDKPYRFDGTVTDVEGGEVTVQHVMIKSSDIQIERPYTPVNDPTKGEKEVRLVVKRVRGGEVGQVIHLTKEGETLGMRGPIPTFSIYPSQYDKIISTGTAISPFLQLLSKLSPSTCPRLEVIHAFPQPSSTVSTKVEEDVNVDWANTTQDPAFLSAQQSKFGNQLVVSRFHQGAIPRNLIESALADVSKDKILVLVCLPLWQVDETALWRNDAKPRSRACYGFVRGVWVDQQTSNQARVEPI
nr:hypothetical protein L203_02988 [Cryptococcus depauperatus CBS 7841]